MGVEGIEVMEKGMGVVMGWWGGEFVRVVVIVFGLRWMVGK